MVDQDLLQLEVKKSSKTKKSTIRMQGINASKKNMHTTLYTEIH